MEEEEEEAWKKRGDTGKGIKEIREGREMKVRERDCKREER